MEKQAAKVEATITAESVDEYHLSIAENNSFKEVHIKFLLPNGDVKIYRLPPAYAHRLSDELCVVAIKALAGRSNDDG